MQLDQQRRLFERHTVIESVDLVVTALTAGATAGLTDTASTALRTLT